ncbi:MAG: hypothetical protein ACLGHX_12850 [Acidimicrobiia bacterium]
MTNPIDDLRRYADDLASEVSPFVAQRAVRSAMTPGLRRPRKAVVVLATTALFGVSNIALAATANPAIPGDPLYGVDRAYEKVVDLAGLGGPRVDERLAETGALVADGRLAEALGLVQETLGKVLSADDPQAELEALTDALDNVPDAVSEVVLQGLVATAHDISTGEADGSDVAGLAQQLGQELGRRLAEENSNRPDDAGPPDSVPGPTNPGNGPNVP